MSILSCSRKNCDSIMCDTYVPDLGYICPFCQDEFKRFAASQQWNSGVKEWNIRLKLYYFLRISKGARGEYATKVVDKFFKKYTE